MGGAAGNVVAASAVVGLFGKEGAVIRLTLLPFVYYALVPGLIGYAVVFTATRGWLNAGSVGLLLVAAVMVLVVRRAGS